MLDPYTTPGKPNSTRFICPLGDWWHDEPDGMPYFGVVGYEQRLKQTEALIQQHLEQHTLVEWVAEIGRLNGEVGRLKGELEDVRDELAFVAKRATEH